MTDDEREIVELKDALRSIYARNAELVKSQMEIVNKNMMLESAIEKFKNDIKGIKQRIKHLQ